MTIQLSAENCQEKAYMEDPARTAGASSIRKSLAILDLFSAERPCLTLGEIAAGLQAPLSTASRIASALCEEGFLEKNEGRLYQLGWKCCRLGSVFYAGEPVRKAARPIMTKLRDQFNETVSLYQRRGLWRFCCGQSVSTQALKRFSNPGDRMPLWAGAAGKCFLAYMSPREVQAVYKAIPDGRRDCWHSGPDALSLVRRRGYAFSLAEREPGISSIAADLFDFTEKPVGCLTLSGPSVRFVDEKIPAMVSSMLKLTRLVSLSLGAPEGFLNFEPTPPDEYPHLWA